VAAQLEPDQLEEFQQAARLLLAHPLVSETWPRPGALAAVRRWETVLRNEFGRVLGYRLDVGRSGARLYRKPATTSVHRSGRTRTGRPLGHLACATMCLALAALEGLGDQTTASLLSQDILRLRSGDDALPVDLTQYDQRRAFVDAVTWLEDRGVLRLCDGAVERWLEGGDALYDIDRDLLPRLLVSSPSVLQDVHQPADFLVEHHAPSEEGRRRWIRQRIARRIVEGPVVNYAELDPEELDQVRHRRTRISADVERLTGCPVEARAEGLLLIDATTEPLSGTHLLASGTEAQAALLWGAALLEGSGAPSSDGGPERRTSGFDRDAEPTVSPWRPVAATVADDTWAAVVDGYSTRFRLEYQSDPERLRVEVKALLARFGLLREDDDGLLQVHAALARYRPEEPAGAEPAPPAELFTELVSG
jgi:uncharacterized protein (TIGR02678 family)